MAEARDEAVELDGERLAYALRSNIEVKLARLSVGGDDVLLEVPIGYAQAALGTEIEVPTLQGKSALKVPRGTQPMTMLRMRGLGLPRLDGYGVGDQLVRVAVEVPSKVDEETEELLRKLAEKEKQQVGTRQRGFWNKVREIFE